MSYIIEDLKNNSTPLIEKAIEEIESLERELADSTEGYGLIFKENGTLQAKIEALEKASQWIPVSERLPETTMPTLLIRNSDGYIDTDWFCHLRKCFSYYEGRVTHWMVLPKPPTAIAKDTQLDALVEMVKLSQEMGLYESPTIGEAT